MYYSLVATSPDKVFHEVENLRIYCEKNFTSSIIVSEMGDNGTNPHINVIVLMGSKRIDNVRRGLLKAYYGAKLLEYELNVNFNRFGALGKCIKDIQNLRNVLNYLKKEDPEYKYESNMDLEALTEGMMPYAEHKKLMDENRYAVRSAEQLLCEMITEYKKEYLQQGLNTFLGEIVYPAPWKEDFIRMIKILANKGYNLTPLTAKIKIYYIEFMSRLGNHQLLESLVERCDEELNRSRLN